MPRRPRFPASHGASYSCVALHSHSVLLHSVVSTAEPARRAAAVPVLRAAARAAAAAEPQGAPGVDPRTIYSGRSPQRGGYRSSVIRRVPAPRPGRADRRASSPLLLGPTGLSCFCDFCGRPCPSRPLFPGFFAVLGVLSVSFGFFCFFRFLLACSCLSFRRSGARSTRVRVRTRPHVSTSPSASSA